MKKILLLVLGLLIVVGGAFWGIYQYTDIFRSSKEFAVADISSLTQIIIEKDSSKIVLTKLPQGEWRINDKGTVKPIMIQRLLQMLQLIEVKSPIPNSIKEEASDALNTGYTIIAQNGSNVVEFTIAELPHSNMGSFGIVKGKSSIYLLHIPGSNFSPASILSVETSDWHENLLLSVLPEQIVTINIDNIAQPNKSFKIYRGTDGKFHLYDVFMQKEIQNYNVDHLNFYLSLYSDLGFKRMLNMDDLELKSLVVSEPESIVSATTTIGDPVVLKFFKMPEGDDYDETGNPLKYNHDRFFIVFDKDRQVAEAAWVDYDLLLQDVNFFL